MATRKYPAFDRVDPQLGPGAVRRPAKDDDIEPDEALVRQCQLEMAGFGNDAGVSGERGKDLFGAKTGMLLVRYTGDQYITAKLVPRSASRRDHCSRKSALHVKRATTGELAVLQAGLQRVTVVADQRDRVVMPIEHQRPPAAGSPSNTDDRRSPGTCLQPVHLESAL